jgi:CHAD domain-containing protein
MSETEPVVLSPEPKPARKKKRANGLSADLPLSEYARAVMRTHFDELLLHEAGTRLGEDIEELHDMRVATRRLRAAFEVFAPAFRPRAVRPLLRDLRAARQALGPVRDLDVFLENADAYQAENTADLSLLVQTWQAQRETARAKMLAYLDSPDFQTFKTDFETFLGTPGKAARRFDPADPHPQITWQAAPVLLYQRYSDVLACESLIPEASPEQLHDLRVRFKKFRYAVEFLRAVLGKPAAAVITDLKLMQDHLGQLNDAHLACDLLSGLLADLESRYQSLPLGVRPDLGGILAYLSSLHSQRRQMAETFPQAWAHFTRPEFRQNLALALSEL